MKLGWKGSELPIDDNSVSIVYTKPPGIDHAVIYLYFQDASADVGRLEMDEVLARKIAYQINDLLASNKPAGHL